MISNKSQYEPQVSILLRFSRGGVSRLRILSILSRPKNCNEIAKELKLEWWTAQRHLQLLLKAALIKRCDFGKIAFYVLTIKGQEAIKTIEIEAQFNFKKDEA